MTLGRMRSSRSRLCFDLSEFILEEEEAVGGTDFDDLVSE